MRSPQSMQPCRPASWHHQLVLDLWAAAGAVCLMCHGFLGMLPGRWIARLTEVTGIYQVVATLVLILLIPLVAPTHQTPAFVFGTFYGASFAGNGIPKNFYLFLLGMLMSQYTVRPIRLSLTKFPARTLLWTLHYDGCRCVGVLECTPDLHHAKTWMPEARVPAPHSSAAMTRAATSARRPRRLTGTPPGEYCCRWGCLSSWGLATFWCCSSPYRCGGLRWMFSA